jgi:Na+/proline symporter
MGTYSILLRDISSNTYYLAGLAALSLQSSESFPTFPRLMTEAEISAGLTLPYAAVALLGSGGAVATLLIVFMAVTSAFSAQLIAVSSILTYDIYGTYINPAASGKRLVYISHSCVAGWGIVMAAFSTGLFYAGIRWVGHFHLNNKD